MKLTQAITNWFHKMFAWWPWKQSTHIEYAPHSSSLHTGSTPESMSKSIHEGVTPQAGSTPRLSTIQEWPERVVQTDVPAKNESAETSSADGQSTQKSVAPTDETPVSRQATPSAQQRLEFLQYLVRRGIVNEGLDEDK